MADPSSLSSTETAYCHLLHTLGSCSTHDFASAIYKRRDTSGCDLATVRNNPACIQLSAGGAKDLKTMNYASSKTSCAAGKGRPRLPRPRSSLESFSMIAYAKERGVTSFFAEQIMSTESVTTHWPGADGAGLVVPAGNSRCILLALNSEHVGAIYVASLMPCDHQLADGVVCESVSAAPPPPPVGGVAAVPPPAPPPPPIGISIAMRSFTRETILPFTELICSDGIIDDDLSAVCSNMVDQLAKSTRSGLSLAFNPLCNDLCWHSCSSASNVDKDSFESCSSIDCADTKCVEFALRECPTNMRAYIDRLYSAVCGRMKPLPPLPPQPPPTSPVPPTNPPPPEGVFLRDAFLENPYDADCATVTFQQCRQAVTELAASNSRMSSFLDISSAPCEGAETEGIGRFIGCSLGSTEGHHALFHVLLSAEFESKHSRRCTDNALHPFCLCRTSLPPPPPSLNAGSEPRRLRWVIGRSE